ncbi:Dabb family protein [Nocardia takedensis]
MALHHVVLMRFTDRADAPEARRRLRAMAPHVAQIRDIAVELDEGGTAVSYDLCLTTVHDSAAELRGYQDHPAHREIAAWLTPRLAARAVVDFQR